MLIHRLFVCYLVLGIYVSCHAVGNLDDVVIFHCLLLDVYVFFK